MNYLFFKNQTIALYCVYCIGAVLIPTKRIGIELHFLPISFQAFWARPGNVESINICTVSESLITNQISDQAETWNN